MTKPFIPVLLTLAAMCAIPAQAAGPVALRLTAEQRTETVSAQGKPQTVWTALGAKHAVHPGDILRYRVQAENTGGVPVSGLVVTQPVPAGTTYVAHSAERGPAVAYSLDGRSFSAQPLRANPAGAVPAAPDTYTALRWRFPLLPPHASAEVVYLVKVR